MLYIINVKKTDIRKEISILLFEVKLSILRDALQDKN